MKKSTLHFLKISISTTVLVALNLIIGDRAVARPDVELDPEQCSIEDNLASSDSEDSTSIRFYNENHRVKVYWIDYEGKRQHYFDLEPGEVKDQQTYVGHPWIVRDAEDDSFCRVYFPDEEPGYAEINFWDED